MREVHEISSYVAVQQAPQDLLCKEYWVIKIH